MSLFKHTPKPKTPESEELNEYFRKLHESAQHPVQARQKPAEPVELPKPVESPVQHGPRENEFTADECRLVVAMCWAMESLKKKSDGLMAKAVQILEDTGKKPEVGWKMAMYYAKERREYDEAKKHGLDKAMDTVFMKARGMLMDAVKPNQEVFDRYFNKENPETAMMTLASARATEAFKKAIAAKG